MNDFSPEIRNSAIWSSDSRKIAKGDAAGVVLEKLGRTTPEDISDQENIRMGHIMEPVIARIFEDENNCRLKHIPGAITHRKHEWLRSHFDYVAESGEFMVECKNYDKHFAQYFSESGESVRIPDGDRAQCLHEAIVYGVDMVYLAVLFGGQQYRDFRLEFTQEEKDAWVARLAEVWGNVQTNTMPPASTPEQAREMWPQDNGHTITANKQIEHLCVQIAHQKESLKQIENNLDYAIATVQNYMGDKSTLLAVDGKTLATWKTAKGSKKFNASLFLASEPDHYTRYVVDSIGSRRFLVK